MTEILRRVKEHYTQGEILDRINTSRPEHRDRIGTDEELAYQDMNKRLREMEMRGANPQAVRDAEAAMKRAMADNGCTSVFTPPAQEFPASPEWTPAEREYLETLPSLG